MATFNFRVPIYGFDQRTGASTNNTVGYPVGTTFSLNAGAALTVINVQDDDGTASQLFSDGYIDTPGDGSSPSTANNDQVLSQAVTINGQTFQPGDQVELEFGFYDNFRRHALGHSHRRCECRHQRSCLANARYDL
ncbi:hypothetical protein [Ruegeria arenilitoris]|uniref:hypothetical protein n=1 Tax=Ruegeria arenilitoris TaxID=1173585 RepID=UPI00147FB203|nr:hypothetical protein [Ruegeria arenilitoris]